MAGFVFLWKINITFVFYWGMLQFIAGREVFLCNNKITNRS